jgi:hypothetical protein
LAEKQALCVCWWLEEIEGSNEVIATGWTNQMWCHDYDEFSFALLEFAGPEQGANHWK